MLDAADVLIDRHPLRGLRRVEGAFRRVQGSAKRRKYHDESTKVSIVSVSRMAGPPQIGQVVLRNSRGSRAATDRSCPGLDVVGREDRQLVVGHRHDAVVRGSRRSGSGSPRSAGGDQPVAKAVVDLGSPFACSLEELGGALPSPSATSSPSRKPELIFGPSPV